MTRLLAVLRPEPGNAATRARATAAGYPTLAMPLFVIRPLAWTMPDPAKFDGMLLTSANTLRFGGVGLTTLAHLPAFAVGKHTADAARRAGLAVAATGNGDVRGIAETASALGFARLLHIAGRDHMTLCGETIAASIAVYDSIPQALEPVAVAKLAGTVALLHSARAARRLGAVVDAAAIARGTIALAAFSPTIAVAAGSGWSAVVSAATPDDAALMAAVRSLVTANR